MCHSLLKNILNAQYPPSFIYFLYLVLPSSPLYPPIHFSSPHSTEQIPISRPLYLPPFSRVSSLIPLCLPRSVSARRSLLCPLCTLPFFHKLALSFIFLSSLLTALSLSRTYFICLPFHCFFSLLFLIHHHFHSLCFSLFHKLSLQLSPFFLPFISL